MTISIATPNKWSDQQEFVNNGTIQNWFNTTWLSSFVRVGVLDLKAPDELYPGAHFLWNPTPTIPKNAVISAASFAGVASHTANGAVDTTIEAVDKDGAWNFQPKKSAHWTAGKPTATFPSHAEVHVFDGATEIAATGAVAGALSASWACRQWGVVETPTTARGEKIGQVLTVATGGTLTSASIRGHKIGAPGGNCWIEVYSVSSGFPDALLATSDTRAAASWSASGNPDVLEAFTFSGGNQIAQTLGVQYAYVLTGDWTINFTSYLQVRMLSSTILGSALFPVVYGESRGLDWGNYISAAAILALPLILGSPSVAWAPPNFTGGTVYTSPDIAALLQAWVNDPSYVPGDPILIRWRPTNPAQLFSRGMKTWVHADTPAPSQQLTLSVDWQAPPPSAVGGGGGPSRYPNYIFLPGDLPESKAPAPPPSPIAVQIRDRAAKQRDTALARSGALPAPPPARVAPAPLPPPVWARGNSVSEPCADSGSATPDPEYKWIAVDTVTLRQTSAAAGRVHRARSLDVSRYRVGQRDGRRK